MNSETIDKKLRFEILKIIEGSPFFKSLSADDIEKLIDHGMVKKLEANEVLFKAGSESDMVYFLIRGKARADLFLTDDSEKGELAGFFKGGDFIGFETMLSGKKRNITVRAEEELSVFELPKSAIEGLFSSNSQFGLHFSRTLAAKIDELSRTCLVPDYGEEAPKPDSNLLGMLPLGFTLRHRVLPLESKGSVMTLGFVEEPSRQVLSFVRELIPGMELQPTRITSQTFNDILRNNASLKDWITPDDIKKPVGGGVESTVEGEQGVSFTLDELIERMLSEGASDLHLHATNVPFWRIDGEIFEMQGLAPLGAESVIELFTHVLSDEQKAAISEVKELDFSYTTSLNTRMRVNIYQDFRGLNAALRLIPSNIMTLEQLGLPQTLTKLCENPNGLVLVTGPAGSGKSTTLAAMLDYINVNRRAHILTLEDPIEFVHKNKTAIFNQREIGTHTQTFGDGLRAALREDPDIILVGEMRDLETIALTLEMANTGHLAFATVHTATAAATIERIIQNFPPEQQSRIATQLSDTLRGVISQALCARKGGGRVAAIEVLVVDPAVSHLIRESKTHQIQSAMQTGKAIGNMTMNESLARLVKSRKITPQEAMRKAIDKKDLSKRIT